ncbi:xanthine dehydrogenase small subunit [Aquipuribacter nitratireducens]|uniref:Xanthine dehydrogenase small subunit n=1 Tax=Aquipuribacter nitratireducens TaxID=650104 RepID=A0ABW0GWU4_9MICO
MAVVPTTAPLVVPGTSPTTTLLAALRAAGRVGTKEGCGDGDCGACTVAVREPGGAWSAVTSCLVPVGAVAGREVLTVEDVAAPDGTLHPVQQALVDAAGSQCGYCTPGFVMSMVAGFHDPACAGPEGLPDDVVEGNLCRCTGYAPIRRACRALSGASAEPPVGGVVAGARGAAVEAAGRTYHRPTTLADALRLLEEHPDATVLAGATDLGIELSHHRLDPRVTVALEDVAELHHLAVTPTHLEIGAGVSLTRLEREAAGHLPALDEMLRWFAARQVRNRATLGGNLGTASPIGDLPPVLLALDAELVLADLDGERAVPVEDFFTGYRETVLRPGELIRLVRVPLARSDGTTRRLTWSYKVGKRGADDISVVAFAATLDLDADGCVRHARLAYGGVAVTPVRAHEVEASLLGRRLDPATVADTSARLQAWVKPLDDHRASAAYRRRLVGSLFEKLVAEHAGPGTGGRADAGDAA